MGRNLSGLMKDFGEFLSVLIGGSTSTSTSMSQSKSNRLVNRGDEEDSFAREIETCLRDMLRDAARLSYLNGDMSKSDQEEYFRV